MSDIIELFKKNRNRNYNNIFVSYVSPIVRRKENLIKTAVPSSSYNFDNYINPVSLTRSEIYNNSKVTSFDDDLFLDENLAPSTTEVTIPAKIIPLTLLVLPVDKSIVRTDIEDIFRQAGLTSINGKAIRFGNKGLRSANAKFGVKNSNHKRRDPDTGNAMARDISIVGGTIKDYSDFRDAILSNATISRYLDAKGWGIINEITPEIHRQTNATGNHFHFGPDSWARRTWNYWKLNPTVSVTQWIRK